ncbi:hypothetical protein BXT86_05155, partial [candidate division WOR-3 bacterium 4484_100]
GGGGPQGEELRFFRRFMFERIYPNPVKGLLKIRFNSPDERKVMIKIYDVVGRLIEKVFDGRARIGLNEFYIRPEDFSAGVYFVRLTAGDYKKTEKVVLIK